ncbi:MAG: hypothetical protein EA403_13765 [Spirochaetaceae bacterium]|nr:MAG: hypothetical protein EA403_13765 [Spirochaetaceae bacterium]
MKISQLETTLGFKTVQGTYDDREMSCGYTSDLLSDVMANAREDCVLITIQAHKNAVAVATMAGIAAILVCNSRPIPDDMIEAARSEGIAVFITEKSQFIAGGEIYQALSRT